MFCQRLICQIIDNIYLQTRTIILSMVKSVQVWLCQLSLASIFFPLVRFLHKEVYCTDAHPPDQIIALIHIFCRVCVCVRVCVCQHSQVVWESAC